MDPLKEHPYYKFYEAEVKHLQIITSLVIHKEDLSPEAQEVWDYRLELEANGVYQRATGYATYNHYHPALSLPNK